MKILFAGTPDFACVSLQSLLKNHQIMAVYCQPDRPAGRGRKEQCCAVKKLAQIHNLSIHQPNSINSEDSIQQIKDYQADIMVVVAYGQLISKNILQAPTLGCLNIHSSLLPRWRGAAPIQRAIEAGDKLTGISIMQMDEGLDSGDILMQQSLEIKQQNSFELHKQLAELGAKCINSTLNNIDKLSAVKQSEQHVTYARKTSKAEAEINWNKSTTSIINKIRAFYPVPICFSFHFNQKIRILEAVNSTLDSAQESIGQAFILQNKLFVQCSDGAIELLSVQKEGKKPMLAKNFINGLKL